MRERSLEGGHVAHLAAEANLGLANRRVDEWDALMSGGFGIAACRQIVLEMQRQAVPAQAVK